MNLRTWNDKAQTVMDIYWDPIFRMVAIFAIVMAAWSMADTRARAECQGQYNEITSERTTALSDATVKEAAASRTADAAMAAFVRHVVTSTSGGDPAQGMAAAGAFLDARASGADKATLASLYTTWVSPTGPEASQSAQLWTNLNTALDQQQHDQAELDKTRREHPVPPPPSQLCR